MRPIIPKIAFFFLFAATIAFYGCDSSVNTAVDESREGSEPQLATHGGSPDADHLTQVDLSGVNASDFTTGGIGTASKSTETITVEVPAGATIERVFLYWSRLDNIDTPAPSTILINGTAFTGSIVGLPGDRPTDNMGGVVHRLDITGDGIVSTGANSFTVQDNATNPAEPLGASVIIFYSIDGEGGEVSLYDGTDFLWADFGSPDPVLQEALRTAVPITFNFDPVDDDRTAKLALFIGDVEPEMGADRPNSLNITFSDGSTNNFGPFPNPFQGFQGSDWDNFVETITIPAGVSSATVVPVSGPGGNPASLAWAAAGFSIEGEEDVPPPNCKVTEDCITVELLASTENSDGTVTYEYKITSDCDRGLSFMAFELPEGVTAINPSTTAPLDKIENPGGNGGPFNPDFRNLKFELGGDFKDGDMATFTYTLPVGVGYDGEIRFRAKYSTTVTDLTLDAEECSLVDDPGDMPPPPMGDCDCDGGVTQLTLTYNGNSPARVRVEGKKDKDGVVFDQMLQPGQEFTISGGGKDGKLPKEIVLLVDGVESGQIHTSCSQPVGPGLVVGEFEVVNGIDREGNMLCPVPPPPPPGDDCGCEGKVRELTLQYNGDSAARIRVEQKKDGVVFDAMVSPGETFTFSGTDKKGTLGTEISIFVDDVEHADIHTSCSRPVGPGLIAGDFEVISGIDREGSKLCPVDADAQEDGKDKKDKDDKKDKKGKEGKGKKG